MMMVVVHRSEVIIAYARQKAVGSSTGGREVGVNPTRAKTGKQRPEQVNK